MATNPNPAPTAGQAATTLANTMAQGHAAPAPQPQPQPQANAQQLAMQGQRNALTVGGILAGVNPTALAIQNMKAAGLNPDGINAPPPAVAPVPAAPPQIMAPTAVTPGIADTTATHAALARYIQSALAQGQAAMQHVQPGHFLIGPNISQLMSGLNSGQSAINTGSITPADQTHAASQQFATQAQATTQQNAAKIEEYRAYLDSISRIMNGSMLASTAPLRAAGDIFSSAARSGLPLAQTGLMTQGK